MTTWIVTWICSKNRKGKLGQKERKLNKLENLINNSASDQQYTSVVEHLPGVGKKLWVQTLAYVYLFMNIYVYKCKMYSLIAEIQYTIKNVNKQDGLFLCVCL